MTLEALLAYGHIVSLLMAATFLASQTALCRSEWLNAAAVERLVRLDRLWWLSALAVLLTGLARSYWGMKGASCCFFRSCLRLPSKAEGPIWLDICLC